MSESSAGGIVVTPEPARVLLGPHGMMLRAREFVDAGEYLRSRTSRFSPVGGFLACRAVELSLKAFLRARGVEDVRSYRHDLRRLLIDADARGLDHFLQLRGSEKELLIDVSSDYTDNQWAYFSVHWAVGGGRAPDPAALGTLAVRVVAALEPVCLAVAQGDGDPLSLPRELVDEGADGAKPRSN